MGNAFNLASFGNGVTVRLSGMGGGGTSIDTSQFATLTGNNTFAGSSNGFNHTNGLDVYNLNFTYNADPITFNRVTDSNELELRCNSDGWVHVFAENVDFHSSITAGIRNVEMTALGAVASRLLTFIPRAFTGIRDFASTLDKFYGYFLMSGNNPTGILPNTETLVGVHAHSVYPQYTFKMLGNGTGTITGSNASQGIDGQTTYRLTGLNSFVTVQAFSGAWYIIAKG